MRSLSASKSQARAAQRLLRVRHARSHRPSAYQLYVVLIAGAIIGPLVWGSISKFITPTLAPAWIGVWGPVVLLILLLGALRFGCWQGPVVFSSADVTFLMGAPIALVDLVRGRLLHALLGGAILGAFFAAVLVIGLASGPAHVSAARMLLSSVGLIAFGTLSVAGSWMMQTSRKSWRVRRPLTLATLALAAALIACAHASPLARAIALWSGPWGWALTPLGAHSAMLLGPVLLVLLSLAASALALTRCTDASPEQFLIRAETRAGMAASIGTLDLRTTSLILKDAGQSEQRTLRRLRRPGRPGLVIAWRDSLALLRNPASVAWAAALSISATWESVTHLGDAPAMGLSVLLGYLAASRLLEPLRGEVDYPDKSQLLLKRPFGEVLLAHCALPTAILSVFCSLTLLVAVLAGVTDVAMLALIPIVLIPTVAAVVLCVALSARRSGQIPLDVLAMATADPSGIQIVLWLAAWPILTLLTAAGPALYLSHALLHHDSYGAIAIQASMSVAAIAALLQTMRRTTGSNLSRAL